MFGKPLSIERKPRIIYNRQTEHAAALFDAETVNSISVLPPFWLGLRLLACLLACLARWLAGEAPRRLRSFIASWTSCRSNDSANIMIGIVGVRVHYHHSDKMLPTRRRMDGSTRQPATQRRLLLFRLFGVMSQALRGVAWRRVASSLFVGSNSNHLGHLASNHEMNHIRSNIAM